MLGAEHPCAPSHRERVAECGYPRVPRRRRGRHTLTHPLQRCPHPQPHPPRAPRPLEPRALLPIKVRMTKVGIQRGQARLGG